MIWKGLKEPKSLYDTLIPLHLITKCVGLSPYTFNVINGKPNYEVSLLGSCYSVTIMLLFVGYYVYAVEARDDDEETNKIARGIDMYQLYGSMTVMSSCIVLNSYYQKTLIRAIKYLIEADRNMLFYVTKINWKRTRNYILGYLLTIMLVLASFEYMNCTMFLRQIETLSTYCLLMCYIPMLVNGFVEAQFISYILILKQRFSVLNKELCSFISKKIYLAGIKARKIKPLDVKKEPKSLSKSISDIRQLHSQLCEVGVLLNKSYSLQILLDIGDVFIGFTTLAYYCFDGCMKLYLNDKNSNLYNTITTGGWTLAKLTRLLILTLTCSVVKKEAALAGEIIYKIENKYEPELSSEIYSFGKQILHWNFKFTAFNFFDIDMSLFYSAISSATTYLMILLQLDIANKQIEKSLADIELY